MARRLFFVGEVRGGRALVTGDEAHHLTRVLRVEPGERYEISDNESVYLAEVETARKAEVSFVVIEKLRGREPGLETELYAALIRFERLEWMLEKATELGLSRFHAFPAERSEKGLEMAARKRLPRWERVAREASEQSRRTVLPRICEPLDDLPLLARNLTTGFLLDELPDAPPILSAVPKERGLEDRVGILVGPEGGWTERERIRLAAAGWTRVSLGTQVLRAETAAIAALAIVNAAWQAGALP